MPEPRRVSALESAYRPGRHGAHEGPAGLAMAERRPAAIVQIAAYDAASAKAAEAVCGLPLGQARNRSLQAGGAVVLWAGPFRWLVVSEAEADLPARLARSLGAAASVTDLSHARTVVSLSGPRARDVLAKGTSIDLHARVFQVGSCAVTAIAKIGAHIHLADATPRFDVMVYRGYGLSFWEWLEESAAEYGFEVG
jgi:sarcosine oxidase subunit gamma